MKQPLPQAEYEATLNRKRMGVCVLFFDESGQLLILKPNYKDGWTVPGGTIDADESPLDAAIRETKEEIGLTVPELKFLLVEYVATKGDSSEGIEFVFYGGVLSKEQVSSIVVETEEFDAMEFAEITIALSKLRPSIRRRTESGLRVIESEVPEYREWRNI